MIDTKQLNKLSLTDQYDIVKARLAVARRALELAKDDAEDVKDVLREFLTQAEDQFEKASWSLR